MKWFSQLNIGAKLGLGFSCMIILIAGAGLAGYRSIKGVQNNLADVFSSKLPGIANLIETDRDLHQLLAAERAMIYSNVKSDIFRQLISEYEKNLEGAERCWKKYASRAETQEEKALILEYEESMAEWKALSRRIVDGRISDTRGGRREALDLSLGLAFEKFKGVRESLASLTKINLDAAQKANSAASATYRKPVYALFTFMGVGLFIGVFLSWGITRSITGPIRKVIEGFTEGASQVAAASANVFTASQELAEGGNEQAASIQETSASMEEISSMTRQNMENADQAFSMANETRESAESFAGSMQEMREAIDQVNDSRQEIKKIVDIIDGIAFQTNLLALNAAVEAARAGEAGAGFAVVADEVRNLATRAAEAARATNGQIDDIGEKIDNTSGRISGALNAFEAIGKSTLKVNDFVGEIAGASRDQSGRIEKINNAIAAIDQVMQQNASSAQENAAAAEIMSSQSIKMKGFVDDLAALAGRQADRKAPSLFNLAAAPAPINGPMPKLLEHAGAALA